MTPQQQSEETRERVRVVVADAKRKGIEPTKKYVAAQLGIGMSTAARYLQDVRA